MSGRHGGRPAADPADGLAVWLVQVGEPLPIDPGHPRLFRNGLFAKALAARGHRVTWWASTFRHSSKTHRFGEDTVVALADGTKLVLLHSPGYRRNVSLERLRDHEALARRFRPLAEREAVPDVIHCGFPTIELAEAAAAYGRRHGVPVVLDARDQWPDIFLGAVPAPLRWAVRLALRPKFRQTRDAFRAATAVSGHTPPFVEFGLRYAGRPAGPWDRAFPFAYPDEPPTEGAVCEARAFWAERGLGEGATTPVFCYFGAFGAHRAMDLSTPIKAARILAAEGRPFRLVLCGEGPTLEACRASGAGLESVLFPGWVDHPKIWTLMRMSWAGLLPYRPAPDFAMSIPNKAVEYLSASLPIVTSLEAGYLRETLEHEGCVHFYRAGDPRGLAALLRRLAVDPGARERSAGRAGAVFKARFSAETVYAGMAEYLEGLARARRA
jgi:glycosyltransferase involved in cell wall biosynthesis